MNLPGEAAAKKTQFDQESVKKIQENLKVIGYDPGEIFGLIGEKTSAAMRQFRADFEIVSEELFSNELITTLFHYAEVAKIHPDWKDITLSDAFTKWINKQPTEEQVRISKLRRSGTAPQIITLLNSYKKDLKADNVAAAPVKKEIPPTPASVPAPEKKEGSPAVEPEKPDAAKNVQETSSGGVVSSKPETVKTVVPDSASAVKEQAKEETTEAEEKKSTEPLPPQTPEKTVSEAPEDEPLVKTDAQPEAPIQKDPPVEALASETVVSPQKTIPPPEASFQTILEQAKDLKAFDPSKMIEWSGGDCDCLANLSGKTIYGFYPFWLAGKPQEINFSLLSRIGYYALSFDSKGEMSPLLHWHPQSADFLTEAKKYRTKVDVVIYKNDWKEWFHFSEKDQSFIIDKTTTNIVNTVNQKMPDTLQNQVESLVSSEESTTMGDGVTLYFDQYPEDAQSVLFFEAFIQTLRKKLKTANPMYQLNLMLPMHAFGKGIYSFENLEKFMGDGREPEEDEIDLLLIMLEEPTTDTKKALRLSFEKNKEFKGIRRKHVLRKIVPVISAVGHEPDHYKQFEDDLIYFEDNFGGVGFWPLPFVEDKDTAIVEKAVSEAFLKKTELDLMERVISGRTAEICAIVCPNRWYFRLAYDLLFVLLLLYGFFALWSSALRAFYLKHMRLFLATGLVAVLIFYGALMCDPYLNDKKDEVTLAFVLTGVFFLIWKNYLKMKEAEYP